jgi:cold shock CspA family protein/ribosome-associated translation inhibitor RaiA
MQTPVEIDFQRCEHTSKFRERIENRIAMLESRFDRITACRVIMRGPSNHHRTGGPYEVAIHLELPDGHHVDVGRAPPEDERYGDPLFAINDAFKRARRMLVDNVRLMQGKVKLHEEPPVATVRMLCPEDDYGFLETTDGREVYFHRNSVLNGGFGKLKPGARVTFTEEMGEKGPQASTVKTVNGNGMQ